MLIKAEFLRAPGLVLRQPPGQRPQVPSSPQEAPGRRCSSAGTRLEPHMRVWARAAPALPSKGSPLSSQREMIPPTDGKSHQNLPKKIITLNF